MSEKKKREIKLLNKEWQEERARNTHKKKCGNFQFSSRRMKFSSISIHNKKEKKIAFHFPSHSLLPSWDRKFEYHFYRFRKFFIVNFFFGWWFWGFFQLFLSFLSWSWLCRGRRKKVDFSPRKNSIKTDFPRQFNLIFYFSPFSQFSSKISRLYRCVGRKVAFFS